LQNILIGKSGLPPDARKGKFLSMFQEKAVIKNPSGLHARPASDLTAFCKNMPQEIRLRHGETHVNPKSIISILAAGLKQGTEIIVEVMGENETETGESLVAFIESLTE